MQLAQQTEECEIPTYVELAKIRVIKFCIHKFSSVHLYLFFFCSAYFSLYYMLFSILHTLVKEIHNKESKYERETHIRNVAVKV
jgi:hypothetical protein